MFKETSIIDKLVKEYNFSHIEEVMLRNHIKLSKEERFLLNILWVYQVLKIKLVFGIKFQSMNMLIVYALYFFEYYLMWPQNYFNSDNNLAGEESTALI